MAHELPANVLGERVRSTFRATTASGESGGARGGEGDAGEGGAGSLSSAAAEEERRQADLLALRNQVEAMAVLAAEVEARREAEEAEADQRANRLQSEVNAVSDIGTVLS
eukprot:gene20873-26510_t